MSCTSILAELRDITNYSKSSKIIKFAGIAQHTAITKKEAKYLRETIYQIIFPVLNNTNN